MKIHLVYLEDLYIIHLMYLEVRDSCDVSGRFVNLYIMVIMVALSIMKDLLAFLNNGHYGCFMVAIMKDFSTFLNSCIRSL